MSKSVRRQESLRRRRNRFYGLLFISPWIAGFLGFVLYPALASLYYSLHSYNVISPAIWVGLENYKEMFFEDPLFGITLYNTLYYMALAIPLITIMGITIALLLNMKVKGMALYRTIFYLPALVPLVAASIIWMWLLNPQYGILNTLLYQIGLEGPGWLADPAWSKPALILMSTWGVGNAMLIYLAGLQNIPKQLYESAEIDGAKWYHKVIHITIPMLSPVIFFNVVIGLIGAFQYFTQAYIMTDGGPADSTLFYSLYLYRNAFQYFRMGYAAAMAWILFILILVVTLLVFKSTARWVYYGGKLR